MSEPKVTPELLRSWAASCAACNGTGEYERDVDVFSPRQRTMTVTCDCAAAYLRAEAARLEADIVPMVAHANAKAFSDIDRLQFALGVTEERAAKWKALAMSATDSVQVYSTEAGDGVAWASMWLSERTALIASEAEGGEREERG